MSKSTNWIYYQPNKKDISDEYSDCVIRALTKLIDKEWVQVFDDMIPYIREMQALPNDKHLYSKYLNDLGYNWYGIKAEKGKGRITPQEFCKKHKEGKYLLRLAHHVVTVVDGKFYDVWDSGDGCVYGYFYKEN